VSDWAKENSKPTYSYSELTDVPTEMTNQDIEDLINSIGGL